MITSQTALDYHHPLGSLDIWYYNKPSELGLIRRRGIYNPYYLIIINNMKNTYCLDGSHQKSS